tara:strand:+ start:2664 stop:3929 length:1266 start_codon:yes stop_codon:yes gene_type:complete
MDLYIFLVYLLSFIGLYLVSFYVISLNKYYKKEEPGPKEDKSVSIIIPMYNEKKSAAKTIETALALNYPDKLLEIIVVDDGSTDNSLEIAKKYENLSLKKGKIVRVFSKKNGGKGSALNYGISKSRKEIVVSMDADSFVDPEALRKMMGFFTSKKVMAVTPSMGIYKPKGIWRRVQQIEYYMSVFLRKSFAVIDAIHITPGAFSAYRREFFVKYGGYDEHTITEDLEIALRIQSNMYVIENCPKAVVYTIGPGKFRELFVQRRRWYTGLCKHLWQYREMFFKKKHGPLGMIILPAAVVTIFLGIVLTVYSITKALLEVKEEIVFLNSINFEFSGYFEFNWYVVQNFAYTLFSQPVFLLSILFILMLGIYVRYSRKQMLYSERLGINFVLFVVLYSILFAFWWIVSLFYVATNKKVVWREGM